MGRLYRPRSTELQRSDFHQGIVHHHQLHNLALVLVLLHWYSRMPWAAGMS